MKARYDCEIACDCVKRANVDLHVGLCKEIFARKHTATHKPTSAQPLYSYQRDIHTRINRLWSPLAYGLGGNNYKIFEVTGKIRKIKKMMFNMKKIMHPTVDPATFFLDVYARMPSPPLQNPMGLVRITSWYPNFNGSHFG